MSSFKISDYASPRGDYVLDVALEMLREHWQNGRQIVPLIGAGISVESGFPVLLGLREHLLALHVMQKNDLKWPEKDSPKVPSYSLERDDWISPARLSERFPSQFQKEQFADFLKGEFEYRAFWKAKKNTGDPLNLLNISTQSVIDTIEEDGLVDLAELLNLSWLELMEKIADHRPELVDMIFDKLGAHPLPGPTHNFLAHCVSWFNIRLLLTTNFDSLAEKSLEAEGMSPKPYDVHLRSEPPQKVLVDQHLSVIKLHGSRYGIRADRSVDQPVDRGHLATLLDYLDDDVVLLCLGYGGGENRITGFISEVLEKKPGARMVRVDPMAPSKSHFFSKLDKQYNKDRLRPRVVNLYYPPSTGLFLLHLYQYVANQMPNTRGRYPSAAQTATPHKAMPTFGSDAVWTSSFREKPVPEETKEERVCYIDPNPVPKIKEIQSFFKNSKNGEKCLIVRTKVTKEDGKKREGGTSQILAQIHEDLFRTHQIAWCDLDDVTSVGAVMGWLYDFVNSRQPDLPQTPLPIALPAFLPPNGPEPEAITVNEVRDLHRAVRHIWSRLSRQKFVIIMDSLSCAIELSALGSGTKTDRSKREAARLLLLIAILMKFANEKNEKEDGRNGHCLLLIGTHPIHPDTGKTLGGYFTDDLKEETHKRIANSEIIWENIKELTGKSRGWRADVPPTTPTDLIGTEVKVGEVGYWNYPQRDWVWEVNADPKLWKISLTEVPSRPAALDVALNDSLITFLQECAWCNRSRSWRQLLQLPSVRDLATEIQKKGSVVYEAIALQQEWVDKHQYFPPEGDLPHPSSYLTSLKDYDERSRALRILLNGAIRRKKLLPQAGGFYYMGGLDRTALRAEPAREETHRRMATFFERNYNQSGDVTALSHYFWHMHQLIEHFENNFKTTANDDDKKKYWQCIEKCVYRMLENSTPARGSLYAYDHCFLLLHLLDKLESKSVPWSGSSDPVPDFRQRVLKAICEIYEDNLDTLSEKQTAEFLVDPDLENFYNARAYYRLQKAHWQAMNATESFKSAHHALAYLFDKNAHKTEPEITEFKTRLATIDAIPSSDFKKLFDAICEQLNMKALIDEFSKAEERTIGALEERLQEKYKSIDVTAHRVLFHRIVERMIRSLIRIARFGTCTHAPADAEAEKNRAYIQKMIEVLLSFGNDLNLGDSPTASTTKLLTARYLSTAGLYAVYNVKKPDTREKGAGLKMTYYNHQAQSRAIRAEGAASKIYEANAYMDEAEMLLWRARITLSNLRVGNEHNEVLYPNATARQEAAVRYLESARLKLLEGNVALASWLEMTVLRAAATADILKRITCQYIDLKSQEIVEVLADGQEITLQGVSERQKNELKNLKITAAKVNKEAEKQYTNLRRLSESGDATEKVAAQEKLNGLKAEGERNRSLVLSEEQKVAKNERKIALIHQAKVLLIADFAEHAEKAAFELGHLLPLMRDDFWRGARAGLQVLRVAGYICRMMQELLDLQKELDGPVMPETQEEPSLIVALETLIRAVNIFDLGRPTPISPLPRAKSGDDAWNDFETKLWEGLGKWIRQIDLWLNRILTRREDDAYTKMDPMQNQEITERWREFQGAKSRFDKRRLWQMNLKNLLFTAPRCQRR